jgi:hypothetical protein
MSVTVLKDVLIACGEGDRLFEEKIPVDLWRAHDTDRFPHAMDFYEAPVDLAPGKARGADVVIEAVGGEAWIRVRKRPRGVSTFDRPGTFKGKHWKFFLIPRGTRLPDGLVVVKDDYNARYRATHYTLAPDRDMPLKKFKSLLRLLFANMRLETA